MRVLRGDPATWETPPAARALTVGVYDGVHAGHRHVLKLLRSMAADRELPEAGIVTFDPHPLSVVAPEFAPPLLTTVEQRLELFADLGLDLAAVVTFDETLRGLSPAAFAGRVLGDALGARLVVVGEDFRFGRDRTGNVASLAELGDAHGFEGIAIPLVGADRPVSSTSIRALVAAGDVAGAAHALQRHHEIRGLVVHGDGRGTGIGFATANLELPEGLAIPGSGVYAVRAAIAGEEFGPAVANIGNRPTFGGDRESVEVHLLDRGGDLYGREMRMRFVDRIRDEQRFDGVDALVRQIERDVEQARRMLTADL